MKANKQVNINSKQNWCASTKAKNENM